MRDIFYTFRGIVRVYIIREGYFFSYFGRCNGRIIFILYVVYSYGYFVDLISGEETAPSKHLLK